MRFPATILYTAEYKCHLDAILHQIAFYQFLCYMSTIIFRKFPEIFDSKTVHNAKSAALSRNSGKLII